MRTLAAGIKRCQLGDIREVSRKVSENGETAKGPLTKSIVNLVLAESSRTTDGDEVQPGFPTTVNIDEWEGRADEFRAHSRELALAVLGLDRNSKEDVVKLIAERGGWSALKGKPLLVEFAVKNGYSVWKAFNRIPT